MLRKMTTRMKQLQEELALESVTNIEFEESSRRSFEFLTGQVKTLKEAFNTLTDTFLQELEHLSGAISGEFFRLEEGVLKDVSESVQKSEQLEKHTEQLEKNLLQHTEQLEKNLLQHTEQLESKLEKQTEQLEKHTEQLGKDLDAVLGVIPKIEDSMLRTNSHVQDRLEQVALDAGRSSTALQLLEEKVNRIENDLREEMEQKLLKQQRTITRQLESMSRVLMTEGERRHEDKTPLSLGSTGGLGGPSFGGDRAFAGAGGNSPFREDSRRDASPWADRRDRDALPSPWREQERERDRPWSSDRGSVTRDPLRLPLESKRDLGQRDQLSSRGGDTNTSTYRGIATESFRDRLSSVHDSPRQSSRRGNSPESQSQRTSAVASERLWQDPRQGRRNSDSSNVTLPPQGGGPAEVSAPKPGHIQVDFDLSGLSPTAAARPR